MAIRRMARVLLPLAWVNSFLSSNGRTSYGASIIAFSLGYLILASHGCTMYGASIIAFALGYFIFVIIWLSASWREYFCVWPGLPQLCHRTAVRCTVRVLSPLAWVNSSWFSYGRTSYAASMVAFGLGYLIFAIIWLCVVWFEYYCLWPGLVYLCFHVAVRRIA